MADGDVTISLSIAGGSTKTTSIDKATKDKNILYLHSLPVDGDALTDDQWLVHQVNSVASRIVTEANTQLKAEAAITPKTFTAAS